MKKLVVLFVAGAMSVVASAATAKWTWSTAAGKAISGVNGAGTWSGDVMIIAATSLSQESAWGLLTKGKSISTYVSDTSTAVSGVVSVKTTVFSTTVAESETKQAFYMVVQSGDNFWISATKSGVVDTSDSGQAIAFSSLSTSNRGAATQYNGAGWYTVQSGDTPEPTSGLLMLVGLGLLGLRRRRA